MHHLSANLDRLKRLSVLGIQCIANKNSIERHLINEAHRYKFMELIGVESSYIVETEERNGSECLN
jgi:hypothetical protein